MPNTYTQIHLQIIFAVKYRMGLIKKEWKDELYKYMTGTVQANKHKLLAINGIEDHVHILIGMRPTQSLADLLQDIKSGSSKWINDNKLTPQKFEWQGGHGAFSYSKSHVPRVIQYIRNQEENHKKVNFLTEYEDFLQKFGVEYDRQYIFKEPL